VPSPASGSYILLHTLGINAFDPFGGDGAYSDWLQSTFASSPISQRECTHVSRLNYEGVRYGKDVDLFPVLKRQLLEQMIDLLEKNFGSARVVILNWHLRKTGTPNGWTGRGLDGDIIRGMSSVAAEYGCKLLLVLTIHESENLKSVRTFSPAPTSLISLNPTVHDFLRDNFTVPVERSKVPGFMTSLHTSSVDLILKYLGTDVSDIQRDAAGACLIHTLKMRNHYGRIAKLKEKNGIVIFGMISARHGTTVANVEALCDALRKFDRDFKVIVVGKESDEKLVRDLRKLALKKKRLYVYGALPINDAFNSLSNFKYAISFDPHGYRDNASAMVNMTRAGNLLFSRIGEEDDDELIARCVRNIRRCEKGVENYWAALADQQPRYRATEPILVGMQLDLFFGKLAGEFLRTERPPIRQIHHLVQPYIVFEGWAIESRVVFCMAEGKIKLTGKALKASGNKTFFEFHLLSGKMTRHAQGFKTEVIGPFAFASRALYVHEDYLSL
jgi:hypothetical protein